MNEEYLSMLKEDFDAYAAVTQGAARYMREVVTDSYDAPKSRLELKLELEEKGIELDGAELDDFLEYVVEDIFPYTTLK